MAEETPVVQNWRLLVVAGVLGIVMAVIYNVHIRRVRESYEGNTVQILRVTRDLAAGERIKPTDVELVTVSKDVATSMGNVMTRNDMDLALSMPVNQRVNKNQPLLHSYVLGTDASLRPSGRLDDGMTSFTLPVDPRMAPGEILRVDDSVNIMGTFAVGGKYANYMILEGAKVLEVGGRIPRDRTLSGSARSVSEDGMSSFRSITIEVSPEVSKKLANLLTHVGAITVTVRKAGEGTLPIYPPGPQINREVASLAETAYGGPPPGAPTTP